MKTVKEMSEIARVSIATLRYYDEIGLLKPAKLSEAGYRLYDNKSIEKLQQIMFFRELEIPLADIKKIMEDEKYDKEQVLLTQKSLLEKKRNRMNGIIELIADVLKGVNTMNFEAFDDNDITIICENMQQNLKKEDFPKIQEFLLKQGIEVSSIEDFKKQVASSLQNDTIRADIFRLFGGKKEFMNLYSEKKEEETRSFKDETDVIYRQFLEAKESGNSDIAEDAVIKLAMFYKEAFHLDNARTMLLELAKEYQQGKKLAEVHDNMYGTGISEYVAYAIQCYYGM